MKKLSFKIIGLSLVFGSLLSLQHGRAQDSKKEKSEIACNLSVFTEEEKKSHEKMSERVFESIKDVKELEDGYAFLYQYSEKMFMMLSEWIIHENKCCGFFSFELALEPHDRKPEIWLKIKGGKDIKDYLKKTMVPLITKK